MHRTIIFFYTLSLALTANDLFAGSYFLIDREVDSGNIIPFAITHPLDTMAPAVSFLSISVFQAHIPIPPSL